MMQLAEPGCRKEKKPPAPMPPGGPRAPIHGVGGSNIARREMVGGCGTTLLPPTPRGDGHRSLPPSFLATAVNSVLINGQTRPKRAQNPDIFWRRRSSMAVAIPDQMQDCG